MTAGRSTLQQAVGAKKSGAQQALAGNSAVPSLQAAADAHQALAFVCVSAVDVCADAAVRLT